MPLRLVIANKAYSSWSLRPWILLAHFKIPFEEIVIPLDQPDTRKRILAFSPNGKCPSLQDGPISVWESTAIIDYVAEKYPDKAIWPKAKAARALARSLAAEMHAGFQALRNHCPTNFRRPVKKRELTGEVEADVARL
ncbi:MAG TPA: glutathione S-transferase, partial [Roseiarcus sp.]|nr:glutathione S-transferase [Roseiarcus sp.]